MKTWQELEKLIIGQRSVLNNSTLLLSDQDFRSNNSKDDINVSNVRLTRRDWESASHVEYVGKLGRKILKSRSPDDQIPDNSPRITRSQLGF